MDKAKEITRRFYFIFFFIVAFALLIVGKVAIIQFVEGDFWKAKAAQSTTKFMNIEAVRGNIYASGGSLLATSIPIFEIRWDANVDALTDEDFNANIDSLAYELANLFQDKTPFEYKKQLIKARVSGDRYHLIKRKVNFNQLKRLRNFPIFRRGKYKGGLIVSQQNKREKPFRLLASRTIGYEKDGVKPVGLEGAYTQILGGVNGKRLMQKIGGGIWMPINDENEIEPVDGADLITTIDINIQDVAHHALQRQLEMQNADHGCVVLMEVTTGNIKAIVNLTRGSDGNYYENYNYAIGESTEPGSTFKLPVFIAALEDGYIDLDDTIQTFKGKHKFYDTYMYDSREGGYGTITIEEAFAYSSNIAVAKTINHYYGKNPQAFIDRLYKMNLNKVLDLEIYGEGKPRIKSADDPSWSGISLPWISHGYEVQLTPLQILAFYNAIANNGVLVKPKFVEEIREYDQVIKRFEPIVINPSICSKETIKKARKMLESVVEYGTATNLKNANFKIAGKTGTAQIANAKYGYRYDSKVSYQASFCGYFPADNPKYSCIVVVNAPSRNVYYGNLVAGPIFKEIADKVYATAIEIHQPIGPQPYAAATPIPVSKNGYYDDLKIVFNELGIKSKINKEADWVVSSTGKDEVTLYGRNFSKGIVPSVEGMDLKDAVFLLENLGLSVKINGRGVIKHQSIPSGAKVIRGTEIILQLT